MTNKSPNQLPDDKKRLLRSVLMMTGVLFFLIGMALVAFPSNGAVLFGEGEDALSRYFGGALVLVGITDVFIAKVIFSESTK